MKKLKVNFFLSMAITFQASLLQKFNFIKNQLVIYKLFFLFLVGLGFELKAS
jgi:hypothetical protein